MSTGDGNGFGAGGGGGDRFNDRASSYVRGRPGYPMAAIRHVQEALGLGPESTVADMGAGTGIMTMMLMQMAGRVIAVERNDEMRAQCDALCLGAPNYMSQGTTAEGTGLPDGSLDAIVAAQAFHWFDTARVRAEWRRILKPGGRVALLWNTRHEQGTPFLEAYEAFMQRWGINYAELIAQHADTKQVAALFGPNAYVRQAFEHSQVLDRAGLAARIHSNSYIPGPDHPDRAAMDAAIGPLFEEHADKGQVTLRYDTEVFTGAL